MRVTDGVSTENLGVRGADMWKLDINNVIHIN